MPTETQLNRTGRVHGEFFSADAQVGAEATMYRIGTKTTRALASTQRLVLVSAVISAAATMRVRLFADDDADNVVDAGEALVDVNLVAGIPVTITWPSDGPEGTTGGIPHVIASAAGNVSVSFEGIVANPTTKTGPVAQPTSP